MHALPQGRAYVGERTRPLFSSVESRLPVSDGWLCQRSAQGVNPSTYRKRLDF